MTIEDLVLNLKKGNHVQAGKAYDTIMADKLTAALDAKKIEVASNLATRKKEVEEK